jgi:hypothetical protein
MDMLRQRRLLVQLLLVISAIAGLTAATTNVLPLVACVPWLVAIVFFAVRNGPGDPDALPSAAEAARRRWVS